MAKHIFVVGAAHIDVHAYYEGCVRQQKDKRGKVKLSIGGTAFNVAANLAHNDKKATLLTTINPDLVVGKCVASAIEALGVTGKFLHHKRSDDVPAYIALYEEAEMISAVTCEHIESCPLQDCSDLEDCIENAIVTVVDCNLSAAQLNYLVRRCNDKQKKVLVAGVSESKSEKLLCIGRDLEVEVASINYIEALHLLRNTDGNDFKAIISTLQSVRNGQIGDSQRPASSVVTKFCSRCKAKYCIITLGGQGYLVFAHNGTVFSFPPIRMDSPKTSGAGDSLLAAVAAYYTDACYSPQSVPDWQACHSNYVIQFVRYVLSIDEASPFRGGENNLLRSLTELLIEEKSVQITGGNQIYKLKMDIFIVVFIATLGIMYLFAVMMLEHVATLPEVIFLVTVVISLLMVRGHVNGADIREVLSRLKIQIGGS